MRIKYNNNGFRALGNVIRHVWVCTWVSVKLTHHFHRLSSFLQDAASASTRGSQVDGCRQERHNLSVLDAPRPGYERIIWGLEAISSMSQSAVKLWTNWDVPPWVAYSDLAVLPANDFRDVGAILIVCPRSQKVHKDPQWKHIIWFLKRFWPLGQYVFNSK